MKALYVTNILNKYKEHSFSDLNETLKIMKNEYARENYKDLLEVYDYLFDENYDTFFDFCDDISNIKESFTLELLNKKEKKYISIKNKLLLTEKEKKQIELTKKEDKRRFVNDLYNHFKENTFEDIKKQHKIFLNYISYVKYISLFLTTLLFYFSNIQPTFTFAFSAITFSGFIFIYFFIGVLIQFYIEKKHEFSKNNQNKYNDLDILRSALFSKEYHSLEKFLLNFKDINALIINEKFENYHEKISYFDNIKKNKYKKH
jgi:hypothetical protein